MKILNMFLKILMVVITFVYPLFFNLLAGCSIAAAAVRADGFSFMFLHARYFFDALECGFDEFIGR